MQMPFPQSYNIEQRFQQPNRIHWRPNFAQRGQNPQQRFQRPNWRYTPQDVSNEHWCETCDRGFRTPEILEDHKKQHQKCNIDGCQFIAHPKVITKHIQMQHATGLFKKISKLQDPEEIKKWREERKKKYPTKENVEKAAAAVKEKIERGEKMGLKRPKHERNHKTDIGGKRKQFNKQNKQRPYDNSINNNKKKYPISKNIVKVIPAMEDTRSLKPFTGIQELVMDEEECPEEPECSFAIEDDDEIQEPCVTLKTESVPVCHALSSLLCDYGSSDEENPPAISKNADNKEIILDNPVNKIFSKDKNSDDESGPEEVKLQKEATCKEIVPQKSVCQPNKKNMKRDMKKPFFSKPKPKIPSTLLRKLLYKEMRQERNIVLQCIRHIVRNNFFDNKS